MSNEMEQQKFKSVLDAVKANGLHAIQTRGGVALDFVKLAPRSSSDPYPIKASTFKGMEDRWMLNGNYFGTQQSSLDLVLIEEFRLKEHDNG